MIEGCKHGPLFPESGPCDECERDRQGRAATDEEFRASAQRMMEKHRPALEKLASSGTAMSEAPLAGSEPSWQPIATAPTDGRWLWFRREQTPRSKIVESAFRWDSTQANGGMWFAGLGWWHQIPLAFTHWRFINDQPAEWLRSLPATPQFTENEIKDVLTSLYQDGHVDLALADRIAALMKGAGAP